MERYRILARRQEQLLDTCALKGSCAYLHFSRALVGLFEDRATARRHFEAAVREAPGSQLASSSRMWMELITEPQRDGLWRRLLEPLHLLAGNHSSPDAAMERVVRDLLEREIVIQQLLYKARRDAATLEALKSKLAERGKELERLAHEQRAVEAQRNGTGSPAIDRLERQIAIRDEKIKELNNQLEALKRIDQEMRQKARPVAPLPMPKAPTHE